MSLVSFCPQFQCNTFNTCSECLATEHGILDHRTHVVAALRVSPDTLSRRQQSAIMYSAKSKQTLSPQHGPCRCDYSAPSVVTTNSWRYNLLCLYTTYPAALHDGTDFVFRLHALRLFDRRRDASRYATR